MQKFVFLIVSQIFLLPACQSRSVVTTNKPGDSVKVAFWNLENLFDTQNDAWNDDDFTPQGELKWDKARYQHKLENLTRVMDSINADIFGMCEIEKKDVLKDLAGKLKKRGLEYDIVHFDSPDERGIDVGLFFNCEQFKLLAAKPIAVQLGEGDKTRDILHVMLLHTATKDTLNVFVNHWPSRRGGESETGVKRAAAAQTLRNYMIEQKMYSSKVLIMGDLNDGPADSSVKMVLKACYPAKEVSGCELMNLSWSLKKGENGTIKFGNKWSTFDQIIVSGNLLMDKPSFLRYQLSSVKVFRPEWLRETEGKFSGTPFRTYAGKKYLGGFSDHFPITAVFTYE